MAKKLKRVITYVILFSIVMASFQTLCSSITGGFSEGETSVKGDNFTVIFRVDSGGAEALAIELQLEYNESMLEIIDVKGLDGWNYLEINNKTLFPFFRTEEGRDSYNVASFTFKIKKSFSQTEIRIISFKAADASGNDLSTSLDIDTVTVKVVKRERPTLAPLPSGGRKKVGGEWEEFTLIVLTISLLIAVGVLSFMVARYVLISEKKKTVPLYILYADSGRYLVVRDRDRVFGREDFVNIIPVDKLKYISRKITGGQFRIIARKVNKHYEYYIQNLSNKNPTLLNGVEIFGFQKLKNNDIISITEYIHLIFRSAV